MAMDSAGSHRNSPHLRHDILYAWRYRRMYKRKVSGLSFCFHPAAVYSDLYGDEILLVRQSRTVCPGADQKDHCIAGKLYFWYLFTPYAHQRIFLRIMGCVPRKLAYESDAGGSAAMCSCLCSRLCADSHSEAGAGAETTAVDGADSANISLTI